MQDSGAARLKEDGSATYRRILSEVRRYGVLGTFLALFVLFGVLRPNSFPTIENVLTILNLSSVAIIVGVGATVPLMMNDFDLSFAGSIGFAGGLGAVLMSQHRVELWAVAVVVVCVAVVIGCLNGVAVAYLNGSSFIITLGTGSILTAFELVVTGQQTVFQDLPLSFLNLGRNIWFGLSPAFVVALIISVIIAFIVEATVLGRQMRAIGGSARAAHVSGVNVRRTRLIGFVVCAIAGACGGVLLVSIAGASYPDAGAPYLLSAFAGAFLGGTMFRRRRFSIFGTVIAVIALEMITQGLDQLNQKEWMINLLNGLILVAAILLSNIRVVQGRQRA